MGVSGWQWTGANTLRWGTNRISAVGDYTFDTHAFRITFDDAANAGGPNEADIVVGDSGGGAFTGTGASAELVGILFARASYAGQPAETSLFGNIGFIADLYAYRNLILSITDRPECANGLDDDGNGLTDYPADPSCLAPSGTIEAPEPAMASAFAAGVLALGSFARRRRVGAQTSSTRSTR